MIEHQLNTTLRMLQHDIVICVYDDVYQHSIFANFSGCLDLLHFLSLFPILLFTSLPISFFNIFFFKFPSLFFRSQSSLSLFRIGRLSHCSGPCSLKKVSVNWLKGCVSRLQICSTFATSLKTLLT